VTVLLGRRLFSVLFGAETKMHDIYAYGIGLYTLIATVLITEFIIEKAQLLRNQQASLTSALKTGLIRLAKWTYLLLIAGILLPLVYGACLDLYVMIPFKRFISPDSAVEMQLLQDWTFGVIHLKIAGRIILYLDGRLAQSLRNVFPGHWTNPNIWLASTKFIFPMIVMGYVALLFPPAIYYIWAWAKWISGFPDGEEDFKSRVLMAYPIVMVVAIVFGAVWLARRAIDKWRDSVRDEIYLVGEVLHNLDETER
jgi:E3 ubiquitin-protein ligase MARCH6